MPVLQVDAEQRILDGFDEAHARGERALLAGAQHVGSPAALVLEPRGDDLGLAVAEALALLLGLVLAIHVPAGGVSRPISILSPRPPRRAPPWRS